MFVRRSIEIREIPEIGEIMENILKIFKSCKKRWFGAFDWKDWGTNPNIRFFFFTHFKNILQRDNSRIPRYVTSSSNSSSAQR